MVRVFAYDVQFREILADHLGNFVDPVVQAEPIAVLLAKLLLDYHAMFFDCVCFALVFFAFVFFALVFLALVFLPVHNVVLKKWTGLCPKEYPPANWASIIVLEPGRNAARADDVATW